jgi:LPS export ABC transporter protein LptC
MEIRLIFTSWTAGDIKNNMRFKKRTLIIAGLGVVLVLAAALILFFDIFSPIFPETMLKIISDRADLEVRNVLYREVEGDGTKWEIRAKKASYLKKQNQATFDQVEVKLFLPDSKVVVLAGDKGQLDTATKDIKISGNVGVTSVSGERFTTDYLHYSADEKRLHTEATVLMETPRMQVRGVGMSLSLQNKDIVVFSRVHALIKQMGGK